MCKIRRNSWITYKTRQFVISAHGMCSILRNGRLIMQCVSIPKENHSQHHLLKQCTLQNGVYCSCKEKHIWPHILKVRTQLLSNTQQYRKTYLIMFQKRKIHLFSKKDQHQSYIGNQNTSTCKHKAYIQIALSNTLKGQQHFKCQILNTYPMQKQA